MEAATKKVAAPTSAIDTFRCGDAGFCRAKANTYSLQFLRM